MIVHWWGIASLFLAILAALPIAGRRAGAWRYRALAVVVAVVAATVPIAGWTLPRWLAGVGVTPSVTSTCLLLAFVARRLGGPVLLDASAWRAAWWFGVIAGVALYPTAFGIGSFDPYALGWDSLPLVVALGLLAIILLWFGNRFALVLALGVLALNLHVLESSNLWDYLTDPILTLFSLGVAAGAMWRRWGAKRAVPEPAGAAAAASPARARPA